MAIFATAVLCVVLSMTSGQLWEHESGTTLYPFGESYGDASLDICDDCSSGAIDIPITFPYFNNGYNRFWINSNGMLSFRHPIHLWIPRQFPLNFPHGIRSIIAPYWSDVNVRRTIISPDGMIYHRDISDNAVLLERAQDDIFRIFGSQYRHFEADWGYVVTWYEVTHDGARINHPVELNTFQVILVTDGEFSFAIFNYGDMDWSLGRFMNGNHARVGYDTGDGENFFEVDGSGTADITDIEGSYYMRLDVNVPSSEECATAAGGVANRVRLAAGGHGNVMQGSAEIRVNGAWRNICDRAWGDVDATVFCTQLGFPGPAEAVRRSRFGPRDLGFEIDRVRCDGEERCILNCTHEADPSPSHCDLDDEAGAICFGAPTNEMVIRLTGSGDDREGNVEVKVDGEFVKICDDGWGDQEADVVCNELGYAGGKATRRAFFGERPSLNFGFERVQCDGSEDTITDCTMAEAGPDCVLGNEAGVVCFGAEHPIRLYDGVSTDAEMEGNVEISIGGRFRKVCDVGWGQVEAQIVCEELGFNGPATALRDNPYGPRNPLSFFTFRCDGTEDKLFNCLRPFAGDTCNGEAAGVICTES